MIHKRGKGSQVFTVNNQVYSVRDRIHVMGSRSDFMVKLSSHYSMQDNSLKAAGKEDGILLIILLSRSEFYN